MPQFVYRSLAILSAVTTLSIGHALPAEASTVVGPEFVVIETAGPGNSGHYTVVNNSGQNGFKAEFIYGFAVTNPEAWKVGDSTTEKGWIAGKFLFPKAGFDYFTTPGFLTFEKHHLKFSVNPETIGPTEQESDFFFGTKLLASTAILFLVDANGHLSTRTLPATDAATTPAVPEPSTWAMIILGFGAMGCLALRRRKKTIFAAA